MKAVICTIGCLLVLVAAILALSSVVFGVSEVARVSGDKHMIEFVLGSVVVSACLCMINSKGGNI